MADYVIIMTTTDSEDGAKELSGALVRERLVACAQRMKIDSVYEWEGGIQDDSEYLILLKTSAARQGATIAALKEKHSYDEPEIVVVPIVDGSAGYLGWVDRVTG